MSVEKDLRNAGLDPAALRRQVTTWLTEDLGERGDLTSRATVPVGARLEVAYVSRQEGVVAGMPVVAAVVAWAAPGTTYDALLADGDRVRPGSVLARLEGPARTVLGIERLTLNLLGHLSGIATRTAEWVAALEGTGARVRDTRKTTPGLRELEKYAVRCGGGTNHRSGLHDGVLVKDNHVAAAGGVGPALRHLREEDIPEGTPIQVEVDDLDELDEALAAGAASVLLDNLDLPTTREAVRRVRAHAPGIVVESSGGLDLGRAHDVGACGVDYLAVGALTHSVTTLDIGLDVREEA